MGKSLALMQQVLVLSVGKSLTLVQSVPGLSAARVDSLLLAFEAPLR